VGDLEGLFNTLLEGDLLGLFDRKFDGGRFAG
jgi:hypothetical protein